MCNFNILPGYIPDQERDVLLYRIQEDIYPPNFIISIAQRGSNPMVLNVSFSGADKLLQVDIALQPGKYKYGLLIQLCGVFFSKP